MGSDVGWAETRGGPAALHQGREGRAEGRRRCNEKDREGGGGGADGDGYGEEAGHPGMGLSVGDEGQERRGGRGSLNSSRRGRG